MKQAVPSEQIMRKYLLGVLSEEERERIEQNMLTDDGFYEDLLTLEDIVEDDLIDQYLNGDLTGREKNGFEQIFLSTTERREKLALVRDLNGRASYGATHSHAAETTAAQTSWWRSLPTFLRFQHPAVGLSLATALLIMLVSCIWLLFRAQRLEMELSQLKSQRPPSLQEQSLKEQLDQQRVHNDELAANLNLADEQRVKLEQELNSLKAQNVRNQEPPVNRTPRQSQTPIFSLILYSFTGRGTGEGVKTVNIPVKTRRVQLTLALDTINPKDYKSYQAAVAKRDGTQIWKTNRLDITARGGENYIGFTLPAALLTAGEYNVELSGVSVNSQLEPLSIYSFRVLAP